jgi:microcin C transport system permease protein
MAFSNPLTRNPVWQRQWQAFRSNKRGYWALWIFVTLFVISLGAELIANEKPLLVSYDNEFYVPVFNTYPETTFGGFFESETNYRDPVVKELINDKGWMLWPPVRYSYNTINYDLAVPAPAPPSAENWLGTDDQGRDVLAGLIYGFRISVLFGLVLTIISSFVVPSFWTLLVILLLFSWMALVDLVRAEFLRCRNMDYVRAAHAMGVRTPVIMFRHMLPNAMVATITFLPFILNSAVVTLTSLDFIGFGMPPDAPSLGRLVGQGKANLHAPWLGISVFATLTLMLTLLVFIGEAIRDAFDTRKFLQ